MLRLVRVLMAVFIAAGLGAGCATLGKPSDEEQIHATVLKVKEALEKRDVDLLMTTFSEKFAHPMLGGKEQARVYLADGLKSGYAENGEVGLDSLKVTIGEDKTSARAYPLDLASSAGAIAAELVLTKEEGGWLVTSVNVDGV